MIQSHWDQLGSDMQGFPSKMQERACPTIVTLEMADEDGKD